MQELTAAAVFAAAMPDVPEPVTAADVLGDAPLKSISVFEAAEDVIAKRRQRRVEKFIEQARSAVKCAGCDLGVGTLIKARDARGGLLVDSNGKQTYRHKTCAEIKATA